MKGKLPWVERGAMMPSFERQPRPGDYRRWDPPRFDVRPPEKVEPAVSVPTPPLIPDVVLPTAAELEAIHQQAESEGHRSGYQVGYQVGYDEAHLQVKAAVERLDDIVSGVQQQLGRIDESVVQGLLDLALEVARQILRQSVQVKPDLLLGVIREALVQLPHFNQSAHLTLHPEDASWVRTAMGDQLLHSGWKILEDVAMERGGCRLNTAHSQIDASLEHRWKTVVAALGRDQEWLGE